MKSDYTIQKEMGKNQFCFTATKTKRESNKTRFTGGCIFLGNHVKDSQENISKLF